MKRVVRFDLWLDPVFDQQLGNAPGVQLEVLNKDLSLEDGLKALSAAHVYHVSSSKDELPKRWWVGAELLARCPKLACVASYGAGYDTVDAAACTRAGVAVVNQAGSNAHSVAEQAIGFVIALSRRLVESDRRLRASRGFAREELMGREVRGRTLGLVGIGHAGSATARLANAMGLTVLAVDPFLDAAEIGRRGAVKVEMKELLEKADFVSLHCPRNQETLGMMNAAAFARMKQGAFFISTARGGIHDERALEAALRSGHLGGAGLDVWDQEPPPLEHPLLKLDTVIATFHTAGVSHESRRAMAAMGAEQVLQVLRGERPRNLVNPEVWPQVERKLGLTA